MPPQEQGKFYNLSPMLIDVGDIPQKNKEMSV